MRKHHIASPLRMFTFAVSFVAAAAFAQPSLPPGKQLRAPDIATIPGAVTMMAADFDLEGTHFEFPYKKWLQVDSKEGTEASITFVPKIPGGSYTFALDVIKEAQGQATFTLKVGDKELEAKEVPLLDSNPKGRIMHKLMWTEIPFDFATKVTINAQVAKAGDEVTAAAKWTRLIMIPHNNRAMFLTPPAISPPSGGPGGNTPPSPESDAKKE